MSARIEARNVTKQFGDHFALRNFSLDVTPGEIFGLIGPNGAGKTTFLRILTGYWLPTEGDIQVDGISVVSNPQAVRQRVGYAPEQPKLYADHRVDSFLRLMAELRGLRGVACQEAVERGIQQFDLETVRRRRIGVLSKGFRQRVSLAQALLHEPPLLVIDEPTVGLDPAQQIALRQIIQGLGGDHTVMLCTHQLSEAEACCNRVLLLRGGRSRRIATAQELASGKPLEELFLAEMNDPEGDA